MVDGHTLSALSVVRSLGRDGHEVLVAAPYINCIAGKSRYADTVLEAPSVLDDAEAYVRWVAETAEQRAVDFLFWTTNESTLALDCFRALLPERLLVDLPPSAEVAAVFDKAETVRTARDIGVPTPATWLFDSPEELRRDIGRVHFPCVVKSRQSCVLSGKRVAKCGQHRYAVDPPALLRGFADLHATVPRPMVQEFVPGYGLGVFLLMREGEPVASFAHRRLREADPIGSGGSFRASIELPAEAYRYSVALLRAMNWRGVAMVEFKQDARDGQPKLLEINGRFWNSLALCLQAGANFPSALLQMKAGRPQPASFPSYKYGVKSHWFGGEMMHLYKVMKGRPSGFPGDYPSRLRTIGQMVSDFIRYPKIDTLQLDDMLPFLFECWLVLRRRV